MKSFDQKNPYSAPRHVLPETTSGHNSCKIYATVEIFFLFCIAYVAL